MAGFSLHDTLVALAVASVVTTIGIPAYGQVVSAQRMSSAVNDLVTALHLARSEAIRRGARAVLCPSSDGVNCLVADAPTDWHVGYLIYIDENANRKRDDDEQVVRIISATTGIRIQSSRYRNQVTYLPNGLAYGTNTTFSFCDDSKNTPARAVILSNSGRPRVARASSSASCSGSARS